MRNSSFHLSTLVAPLALFAGVLLGACGQSSASTAFEGEGNEKPANPNQGGTTFGGTDAGTTVSPTRGSPLCAVVAGQCTPDDDGQKALAYGALPCASAPGDGGAPDSNVTGCRITKSNDDTTAAPRCVEADRKGLDGASCEKGRDCAPGFDCVDGEKGSVCRRYCCSGSCETHSSQNGGPTFCDVQKLVETIGLQAPVCMPLKTCKLLVTGQCGDKETCAIVTDKGVAGCVPIGTANVGGPCDEEHCAADLTCLGSPGDRRCYKLCKTDGAECGTMQKCATGSVFTDTSFGVCQDE